MATSNIFSKIRVREGDISLMSLTSSSVNTSMSNYVGFFDYNQVLSQMGTPNTAGATDISARFTYGYSHINEEVNIISVDDNNRYYVKFTSSTHLKIYIKTRTEWGNVQETEACDWDFGSLNPTRWGPVYLFIVQTTNYKTLGMHFLPDGGGNGWYFFGNKTDSTGNLYSGWFITNLTAAPTYEWTAWETISGNNGQYRCNLTTIKDSSIGDLSGESSGASTDFDRIAGQSDIWSVFLNTPYDTETTIAYSGNAYLTLELHEVVGQPTKTEFVFRFYGNNGTLLFPISFQYITGGDYPDKHVYLSFVYDDNAQAAVFTPVRVSASGTYYWGYNISGLSDDDLLYVWMWLQMSGAGSGGDPSSPYDTGSEDNGGGGGNPQHQDHLQVGGNPTYDGSTSGMFTCYLPTSSELEDIADFLWSSGAIDNARKYFNNFADNIIALYVLPYSPVNPPTKQFKVGGLSIDTLPNVKYVGSRFVDVNMGEYIVEPRWTSYLDYAPFTKFEIYLPGIGVQALDTDEIMSPARDDGTLNDVQGSTLSLTYKIDLLTGICVAYVKINGEVRYQFPGKLGFSIPITGQDFGRIITGFTTVAAGIAGGIAYGGIAAPLKSQAVGHLVGGEVSAAVAGTVNAMKPEVHRSGNLSCEVSSISYETPYLIRTSPNKPLLVNQEVFTGFPSYKSGVLSDFDGYTECIDAHVEGISCTETERDKILEWLRKGVIL